MTRPRDILLVRVKVNGPETREATWLQREITYTQVVLITAGNKKIGA